MKGQVPLAELIAVCDSDRVVTERQALRTYESDGLLQYAVTPRVAVLPDTAEQVRDVVQVVFHEFVSMSIQHLMHEMGQRLLARFPQLAGVSFEGQNRLWDTAAVSEADEKVKVYTDPRPPYGSLHLTLTRE